MLQQTIWLFGLLFGCWPIPTEVMVDPGTVSMEAAADLVAEAEAASVDLAEVSEVAVALVEVGNGLRVAQLRYATLGKTGFGFSFL